MLPALTSRRNWLASSGAFFSGLLLGRCGSPTSVTHQLAHFRAEVTPPSGHPLLGGLIESARKISDPLFAHGWVLLGPEQPIVLAALDWCEIRNDAHERWRTALAEAAGTVPQRVLVSSLHQHDAPLFDLAAQRLIEEQGVAGAICDPKFHEQCVQRVAGALRESLAAARPITHIGVGQAKVEQVASNRRVVEADGKVSFNRSAVTRDPDLQALPEGTIDPWLKTLSFWSGDIPVAALSCFAVHPITNYGQGEVSSDFVGLARERRQQDDTSIAQIYVTGCSGDVTAGKYTSGDLRHRPVLAERLYQAMGDAWETTERHPLTAVAFRSVPLPLPPRGSPGFTPEDLRRDLEDETQPFANRALAALGLSWRQRLDAGHVIDLPLIDFGPGQVLLMPGETFVEYQLQAQQMRPDSFVMAIGYGECAPGYIPTAKASAEGFDKRKRSLKTWMWVDPDAAEGIVVASLEAALKVQRTE